MSLFDLPRPRLTVRGASIALAWALAFLAVWAILWAPCLLLT